MNIANPNQNIKIVENSGQLMVSSKQIAGDFEKRHADVLRSISELECSSEFIKRNFAFSTYRPEGAKRDYPYAKATRDGFVFLAMGFTGKEAAQWKEKYIAAFNAMEARLRQAPVLDLNDASQLRGLLGSYAERTEIAEAKVEEFQPKAIAFDRLDTAEGNLTPRPASKVLGYPERKLTKWLEMNRWGFRSGGKGPLQAHVDKRNRGYLDHKLHRYEDVEAGEWKTSIQLVITPKGLARLAKLLPVIGGAV